MLQTAEHLLHNLTSVLLITARSGLDAAQNCTTTATSNGKMPANLAAVGDVNINKLWPTLDHIFSASWNHGVM